MGDIYQSLKIEVQREREGIYGQPTQIFNLEKFKKKYDKKEGINPKKVKFNKKFLDPLYNPFFVKKPTADTELIIFLSMFKGDFTKGILDELQSQYQVNLKA